MNFIKIVQRMCRLWEVMFDCKKKIALMRGEICCGGVNSFHPVGGRCCPCRL